MDDIVESNLPFKDPKKITKTGGSVVYGTGNFENVVKVDQVEFPKGEEGFAFESVINLRERENIAKTALLGKAREAFVKQNYVLGQGDGGGAVSVRTQKFVDGVPLAKLGKLGFLNLSIENRKTLEDLLLSSMNCYLKNGSNYDICGGTEDDSTSRSITRSLKRVLMPLSFSNNIFATDEGVKFIDPNVYGRGRGGVKRKITQGVIFLSTFANYVALRTYDMVSEVFGGKGGTVKEEGHAQ